MKKFITLALALTTTVSAFAATSGSLSLKGFVPEKLSIAITPEPEALLLPLDVTQSGLKVGSSKEKSNSNAGYKVTISSANGGKLKRNNGTETFDYALSYGGVALTLSADHVITQSTGGSYNVDKDILISYTGKPAEEMTHGNYLDTVTFTIAAN